MPCDWEGGFVHEKGRFAWMRLRQGGAGNLHYFTPVLPAPPPDLPALYNAKEIDNDWEEHVLGTEHVLGRNMSFRAV